eukprot:COSAG01_NODE_1091_length_11743_cov_52.449244_8_plen_168_part_00
MLTECRLADSAPAVDGMWLFAFVQLLCRRGKSRNSDRCQSCVSVGAGAVRVLTAHGRGSQSSEDTHTFDTYIFGPAFAPKAEEAFFPTDFSCFLTKFPALVSGSSGGRSQSMEAARSRQQWQQQQQPQQLAHARARGRAVGDYYIRYSSPLRRVHAAQQRVAGDALM